MIVATEHVRDYTKEELAEFWADLQVAVALLQREIRIRNRLIEEIMPDKHEREMGLRWASGITK